MSIWFDWTSTKHTKAFSHYSNVILSDFLQSAQLVLVLQEPDEYVPRKQPLFCWHNGMIMLIAISMITMITTIVMIDMIMMPG